MNPQKAKTLYSLILPQGLVLGAIIYYLHFFTTPKTVLLVAPIYSSVAENLIGLNCFFPETILYRVSAQTPEVSFVPRLWIKSAHISPCPLCLSGYPLLSRFQSPGHSEEKSPIIHLPLSI